MGMTPDYKNVEEMQAKIDKYFSDCDSVTKIEVTDDGERIEVPDPDPYTVSGLALALGFTSRQTLLNYQDKPEFMDTIKKAKLRILMDLERNSIKGKYNPTSVIFNLKNNFGYTDKMQIESEQNIKMQPYDLSKLTDEQINQLLDLTNKAGIVQGEGAPESN